MITHKYSKSTFSWEPLAKNSVSLLKKHTHHTSTCVKVWTLSLVIVAWPAIICFTCMSLHTYLNQTWNTQQHQRVMTHVQRENTANLQAGELPASFHFLQWAFVQQAICQVGSCLVSSCSTFSHAAEKHGLRSWSIPHGLRSWSIPVLWS